MASSAKDIQLRELKDTITQLKTMVSEQTELIRSLRLVIDEKTSHEKALQEQVDYLTKKLFGSSSERRTDDIPGQQHLFDEAEVEQDPSLLEEETVIREHTRKKKATHEDLFKGLKVEKVVIPLPDEDQVCPVCGTQMVLIGEEYVRRELEFIPATCKVIEYYSQSYGCPSCKEGLGDTEKPVIVKSQVPQALVGKGPATASTVAWTMYQKYANGLPLYRQEKDWLFSNQERQPCKGVPERLSWVSGNGWLSGLQQSAGYQTVFLLGTYPPVLYRCRSQRETV